ncbi:hypothetical protein HDK90DRAFT_531290 [Phyllosticta capitalensis]|uniref:NACHT domain-containing protein n=1 Tax=Phyllosticta capitalensis TaxID=121624 RepID=A0ABR1YZQ7_9PEZI
MPEPTPYGTINQRGIYGPATGFHQGDNNFEFQRQASIKVDTHIGDAYYNSKSADLPLNPKDIAEKNHLQIKSDWDEAGTCGWLRKRDEYQGWAKTQKRYPLLWIHGNPGYGKTRLMSRAIEFIREDRKSDSIDLLYFYTGFRDDSKENQSSYKRLLMTFWKQAQDSSGKKLNTNWSEIKIQDELNKVLAAAKRDVYMVIDAIDQLSTSEHFNLRKWLETLVHQHQEEGNQFRLAIIISSRDCFGLDYFREQHEPFNLPVKPEDNFQDIKKYLERNLDSDLFQEEEVLKDQVVLELTKKSNGMFLWAKIQLQKFCDMTWPHMVERALQSLHPPEDIAKEYEGCAEKFERLEYPDKQIALRTVALLAHTTGSFSKEILLVALAIDIEDGKLDPVIHKKLQEEPTIIIQRCSQLVDVNEKLGVVTFNHGLVYEFFKAYKPEARHKRIAEVCLAYLCSPDFMKEPFNDAKWYSHGSLEPFLLDHPFLEFASCTWATSTNKSITTRSGSKKKYFKKLKKTHGEILRLLKQLFGKDKAKGKHNKKKNLLLSFQVYLLTLGKSIPSGVCHEHIVSYFGLHKLFDYFHKKRWLDLNKRDEDESTMIHWAIRNVTDQDALGTETGENNNKNDAEDSDEDSDIDESGSDTHSDSESETEDDKSNEAVRVVKKLIKYKADLNARNKKDRTPLYYAAYYGNLPMVRLLLKNGAEINVKSKRDETALIAACRKHHEEVVLKLIKAKADVKVQSFFGTALQAVSLVGCVTCARAILRAHGNDPIEESRGPFGTSLHAAAFYGHSEVVGLLLDQKMKKTGKRKFDVNISNDTYGTALTAAASGCNMASDTAPFEDTFDKLLIHKVDVNHKGGLCGPALRAAAANGHELLVQKLLEAGADISVEGHMGTAYQAAEEEEDETIKELLLQWDRNAPTYGKNDPRKGESALVVLRRELFRFALFASHMVIIDSLIKQVVRIFEKEIVRRKTNNGDGFLLESMVDISTKVFHEVITQTTTKTVRIEAPPIAEAPSKEAIIEEVEEDDENREGERTPPKPQNDATQEHTTGDETTEIHTVEEFPRTPLAAEEASSNILATGETMEEDTLSPGLSKEEFEECTRNHSTAKEARKEFDSTKFTAGPMPQLTRSSQVTAEHLQRRKRLWKVLVSCICCRGPDENENEAPRKLVAARSETLVSTTGNSAVQEGKACESFNSQAKPVEQSTSEPAIEQEPHTLGLPPGLRKNSSGSANEELSPTTTTVERKASVCGIAPEQRESGNQVEVKIGAERRRSSFTSTFSRRQSASSARPRLDASSRRGSFVSISQISKRIPSFDFAALRKQLSFGRDDFEGQEMIEPSFPNVLDRLTRAAVQILQFAIVEHAIEEGGDRQVVKIISEAWIDALNSLVSHPGFGESMLQKVVNNRTEELAEYLKDPNLKDHERMQKAEHLARVGVELLLTAVQRGAKLRQLTFILSKLWVSAINNVEGMEGQGDEDGAVWTLIHLFTNWFAEAIMASDQSRAQLYANAGVEVLRGAALSQEKSVMEKFVDEWVKKWMFTIEKGKGNWINGLIEPWCMEYKKCIVRRKYEEALGLALAGMGLLRAAITLKDCDKVAETLQPMIVETFHWTLYDGGDSGFPEAAKRRDTQLTTGDQEYQRDQATNNNLPQGERGNMDIGAIFDAVASLLYASHQRNDRERLLDLAALILDSFETLPSKEQNELEALVRQRIFADRKGVHDAKFELQLRQVSTTVIYLLDAELSSHGTKRSSPQKLKALAKLMPGITQRADLLQYTKAIQFLGLPNVVDKNGKTLDEAAGNQDEREKLEVKAQDKADEAKDWSKKEIKFSEPPRRQDEEEKAQDKAKGDQTEAGVKQKAQRPKMPRWKTS